MIIQLKKQKKPERKGLNINLNGQNLPPKRDINYKNVALQNKKNEANKYS